MVDSGIDGTHPHFQKHKNLKVDLPLEHQDFTPAKAGALTDPFGHGTHVAGIIAGQVDHTAAHIVATTRYRNENGEPRQKSPRSSRAFRGWRRAASSSASRCWTTTARATETGRASSIMAALQYIQRVNGNGRRLLVHGVNLSVGYDFDPEWFACGQSPLCVEVDRLVRSGVVVVVAAGNSGYGFVQSEQQGSSRPAWISPSTIPETRTSRSRWAPRTATCRTPTACRISRPRDRPATAA